MQFSLRLFLILPLSVLAMAQTVKPGTDGVYEVPASSLKNLDRSATVQFPPELAAYELADTVAIEITISPAGKVTKAKAVGGKIDALKEAAEKAVKKWAFAPYLISGTPVPVRTKFTFEFKSTLDLYHDPNGDAPVHVDQKTAQALVVKRIEPQYPQEARSNHIQGDVELRVIVGEDGRVHGLHILKGHPILAAAAYSAVHDWTFKPYVENGKQHPMDTTVTAKFSMP